jgi:predicted glycosyltransferase
MTRIAICTDEAVGLGPVRQGLAIAEAVSRLQPQPAVLLISGSADAARLPRPDGCDLLVLPGPARSPGRDSAPQVQAGPAGGTWGLQAQIALAALTAFSPDLLVLNRQPREPDPELERAPGSAAEALDSWLDAVWVYRDRRVHDTTAGLEPPRRLRATVVPTGM